MSISYEAFDEQFEKSLQENARLTSEIKHVQREIEELLEKILANPSAYRQHIVIEAKKWRNRDVQSSR